MFLLHPSAFDGHDGVECRRIFIRINSLIDDRKPVLQEIFIPVFTVTAVVQCLLLPNHFRSVSLADRQRFMKEISNRDSAARIQHVAESRLELVASAQALLEILAEAIEDQYKHVLGTRTTTKTLVHRGDMLVSLGPSTTLLGSTQDIFLW